MGDTAVVPMEEAGLGRGVYRGGPLHVGSGAELQFSGVGSSLTRVYSAQVEGLRGSDVQFTADASFVPEAAWATTQHTVVALYGCCVGHIWVVWKQRRALAANWHFGATNRIGDYGLLFMRIVYTSLAVVTCQCGIITLWLVFGYLLTLIAIALHTAKRVLVFFLGVEMFLRRHPCFKMV